MEFPIMDHRNSQEILECIGDLAKSYTPEWNYSPDSTDFGIAIAKIYSDMMAYTLNLRNLTPYNHYLTFLNLLNAKILPPIPATGFIKIEVDENIEDGIYIEKGCLVYASANNEEGKVFYQLSDGIYADKVKIENIICTNGTTDKIVLLNRNKEFHAFDTTLSENLQKHAIYISDDTIFDFNGTSDISLQFNNYLSQSNQNMLFEVFSSARFEYYTGTDWKVIEDVVVEEDRFIRLRFIDCTRPTSVMDKVGLYIRCLFEVIPQNQLMVTEIKCKSQGENIFPYALSCDDNDLSLENFFPFDENYYVNNCFYICCDHVFIKKKAEVTIDWVMEFVECKPDIKVVPLPIQYKKVMNTSDFMEKAVDDISIERVVWEYFNGNGWVRLFPIDSYGDFFSKTPKKNIIFTVPPNIEVSSQGGFTGYYIRARIIKINNAYSYGGKYIAPYVKSIKIGYQYHEHIPDIKEIIVDSNLAMRRLIISKYENVPLFKAVLLPESSMYFVLSKGLSSGPIRILFSMGNNTLLKRPPLRWEYFANSQDGMGCWKRIHIADETKDFSTSSIITFMGEKDFYYSEMFGQKGYFIRIVNVDNQYQSYKTTHLPYIKSIDINTIGIMQKTKQPTEYFFIEASEKNKICELVSKDIFDIDVWVDEKDLIATNEINRLVKNDVAELEYDSSNKISKVWVKWTQTENISICCAKDRVYEVEYIEGRVRFGNGVCGKIPTSKNYETVRVDYSITEGAFGNININEIHGFADSIPNISKVENLKPVVGGIEKENINHVSHRIASKLSSSNRLVTLEDYEQLILTEDRRVRKVKCIPHVNRFNEKKMGCISIVILPIDYMCSEEQFDNISHNLKSYVLSKSNLFINEKNQLDIFEATYIAMSLSFTVLISEHSHFHQISQAINQALEIFLNPIKGNFDGNGFDIGSMPNSQSIYNCIAGIKNIKMIKNINIFTSCFTKEGKKEIDLEEAYKNIFAVPIFGSAEIDYIV